MEPITPPGRTLNPSPMIRLMRMPAISELLMPMMNSTPQSVGCMSRRISRLAAQPATMPTKMKTRMVHMARGAPVRE